MMQLDTFGPHNSIEVEINRAEGLIPLSPNSDKNFVLLTKTERKKIDSVLIGTRSRSSSDFGKSMSKQDASYQLKDPRSRRMHWFNSYESKKKVRL
jgi:hypothetical protein